MRNTVLVLALSLSSVVGCDPDDPDEILAVANRAGCDGVGGSCTARGACCDTHDDCIDRNCPGNMGNVLNCTPLARLTGRCPAACAACHDAVVGCVATCQVNPDAAGCGPSTCCNGTPDDTSDDNCGEQQACYDRTKKPPELITDPCECATRKIDLSPSPPRPETHCCDDNGWGCCAGEGEAPGKGGGGCCDGLEVGDDGKCERITPTETDAGASVLDAGDAGQDAATTSDATPASDATAAP